MKYVQSWQKRQSTLYCFENQVYIMFSNTSAWDYLYKNSSDLFWTRNRKPETETDFCNRNPETDRRCWNVYEIQK